MDAGQALGLILYVAIVVGILHLLVAIARWTLGSEKWRNHALWGVVLLVVGASGFGVVGWLFEGGGGGGGLSYFVVAPESVSVRASKYFPVEVRIVPIRLPPGYDGFRVEIDWGDGSRVNVTPRVDDDECRAYLEPMTLRHTYMSEGVREVTVRIVPVQLQRERYDGMWGCSVVSEGPPRESFVVYNVTAPWTQYANAIREAFNTSGDGVVDDAIRALGGALAGAFERITDLTARIVAATGINPGDAMYYLVAMPTSSNFPAFDRIYDGVLRWGWLIAVILAYVGLIYRGLFHYDSGADALIEWLKNVVLVAAGIYGGLMIYDAAASAWNIMTLSLARLGQLGSVYALILGASITIMLAGALQPSIGQIGAFGVILLYTALLLGILKWVTTIILVLMLPAVLPLHLAGGKLQALADKVVSLLLGMFLFSLAAALTSAVTVEVALSLTETMQGKAFLFAAALPIVNSIAGYMIAGSIAPATLPGAGILSQRILGRAPTPVPAPTLLPLPRPPTPYPPTTVPGPAGGAPGAALSGAVVGTVPTPVAAAGPVRSYAHIGASDTGLTMARPRYETAGVGIAAGAMARPRIEASRPTRLSRLRASASEWARIARGEIDVETPDPRLRDKLYTGTAKLTGKLASNIKRSLIEFDRTLQQELGISIIEKPITKRAMPAARYTYQAAKWAAPRTVRLVRGVKEKIKEYWGRSAGVADSREELG